jgi:spermidine synthase
MVRFLASFSILIVPTTLMGATLPLLVRNNYSRPEGFGATLGILYAVNTLGAVFGSFFSGMVLIPRLGHLKTMHLTATTNLFIFMAIATLRILRPQVFAPLKKELATEDKIRPLDFKSALVLIGYLLSGAAAMIYQVAWFKRGL